MKFVNKLMRKGFKIRYLNFFYNLFKAHKKKVLFFFYKRLNHDLNAYKKNKTLLKKEKSNLKEKKDLLIKKQELFLPKFLTVLNTVFRFITLKVELKIRKLKKREVSTPSPISPRRGQRKGFEILLKNAKNSVQKVKRARKLDLLYRLVAEIWLTFRGNSETTKDIISFTNNVLENTENFRDTELFSLRRDRRFIISKKYIVQLKKRNKEKKKLKILKEVSKKRKKRKNIIKKKKEKNKSRTSKALFLSRLKIRIKRRTRQNNIKKKKINRESNKFISKKKVFFRTNSNKKRNYILKENIDNRKSYIAYKYNLFLVHSIFKSRRSFRFWRSKRYKRIKLKESNSNNNIKFKLSRGKSRLR